MEELAILAAREICYSLIELPQMRTCHVRTWPISLFF